MIEKQKNLIEKFRENREKLEIRTKLALIIKSMDFLVKKMAEENLNKTKAFAVLERDRIKRRGDNAKMDQLQSSRYISR